MAKLIVCRGLPASGKSTWAKAVVEKDHEHWKRVNKDDLRSMVHVGVWSKTNEKAIVSARNALVRAFLADGYSVIVDDTNIETRHIKDLFHLVNSEFPNVEFEVKDFDAPVDVCIMRDWERGAKGGVSVGKSVIKSMHERYQKVYRDEWKTWGSTDVSHQVINPKLPWCIIVDIDGTVAKHTNRSPFDWSRVSEDVPKQEIIDTIKSASREFGDRIIFMSGRDSACREDTLNWLNKYFTRDGIAEPVLYMRKEGDNRKDYTVKRELYETYIRDQYNVRMVFDDRDQVVHMWRKQLGLLVLQVDYGNF